MQFWTIERDVSRSRLPVCDSCDPARVFDMFGFDVDPPMDAPTVQVKVPLLSKAGDAFSAGSHWLGNAKFWTLLADLGERHHDRMKCVVTDRKSNRSEEYSIINVRHQFSCLTDSDLTIAERFAGFEPKPIPLDPSKIPFDRHLFKVWTAYIVSDRFKQEWEARGLTGIEFRAPEDWGKF